MSSLLPSYAVGHLIEGLSEYLTTSFSLADGATAAALESFLKDPTTGMFHGPYVRTRLPYAPATNWAGVLEWLPHWFTPYRHQAEAFRRLASHAAGADRRPEPTLVVTGTGSGKTESFLYPILDHCRRQRLRGHVGGIKALILYPMNALANDQAARLATLITEEEELHGIRAGIYTGEAQGSRTSVSAEGLITDRETMRQAPPDILLTNYKMLDQLLLRDADAPLWEKSATTLQYVALDEFHTYDGAQGTDVALLLRRMGLRLKKHQPEGFLSPEETRRPLGAITPVATSATLGSGERATDEVLDFAHTIFGEQFPTDAVVRETILDVPGWRLVVAALTGIAASATPLPTRDVVREVNDTIAQAGSDEEHAEVVHRAFCEKVFGCSDAIDEAVAAASVSELIAAVLAHSHAPVKLSSADPAADTLVTAVFPADVARIPHEEAAEFLSHTLTEIAHLRAEFGAAHGWDGKKFPGVETHLWVREVSRLDRRVGTAGTLDADASSLFRWADNGTDQASSTSYWLPACYCRNCGRSGWMIALQPGEEFVETTSKRIRQQSMRRRDLMRPLLDATSEITSSHSRVDDDSSSVMWLNLAAAELSDKEPAEEDKEQGGVAPVLTFTGAGAGELAAKDTCPSCGEADAIRFVGSSVATLLSVTISNLFGMGDLDAAEKKSLVFVDSVQDAAHRAGFVQARARTFAIRTRTRQAVGNTPTTLAELPRRLMAAAEQEAPGVRDRAKFELVPPAVAESTRFLPYWQRTGSRTARHEAAKLVRNVLALELALEFGDRADLTRSLVSTGALSVGVAVTDEELRAAVDSLGIITDSGALGGVDLAWARGVLEAMRQFGGIASELLTSYVKHDGNAYLLNRREAAACGVPRFARGGAPAFPRTGRSPRDGARDYSAMPVASTQGFYARWTAATLGISAHDAARVVADLFAELAQRKVITAVTTDSGATMYTLLPQRILVSPEDAGEILECGVCRRRLAVDAHGRQLLNGVPCLSLGCAGHMSVVANRDNYYRRLYHSRNIRTVVSSEHTSLLRSEERIELEKQFKKPVGEQEASAPNVLVATPTLEMGIDIGDLSTVMLASLPTTVASYVQRVGRAGRLSGNSLVVAMVVGRYKALARLTNPVETIGGDVAPPAAFLSAREILHRQFAAYLIDSIDFTTTEVQPYRAESVFGTTRRNLVDELVDRLDDGVEHLVDQFCSTIDEFARDGVIDELAEWVRTEFAAQLRQAQKDWNEARHQLIDRRRTLAGIVDALQDEAASASGDEETAAKLRRARAALRFTSAILKDKFQDEHWIAALERYGLLPNFTLLDDAVEFHLSVSRAVADTGEFETEAREYSRGISSALFELAPGATFYAQGIAATIDSVDLGPQNSALQRWRLCPTCSYSEVYPAAAELPIVGPCPACGAAKFADLSQVLTVVEMRRVSASVDYSRSAITDRSDDRQIARFERALSMVIPDGGVGASWFLTHTGFGIQYLPQVEMRWLNLGRPVGGETSWLMGQEVETPKFWVCRECGHVDSKAGENRWQDHKPWCSLRHARDEDTLDFALGRRLTTQGVLMHLPSVVTAADVGAVPSLIAALRMGFKQYLGGNPDHLDVAAVHAAAGGRVHDMLLLHDAVPGGTGYLSQFTEPEDIRRLLLTAYERLRDCSCAAGPLKACPHCLLPFSRDYEVDQVSRETAEAALLKILLDDPHPDAETAAVATPPADAWEGHFTDAKPAGSERSDLEARFLEQLRHDLKDYGATVTESTRGGHALWTIRFPNSKLTWTMKEQGRLPDGLHSLTQPDFYFEVDGAELNRIAVYTDGASYHASRTHNGVAADINRRSRLYEEGIVAWSLTADDLNARRDVVNGTSHPAPSWYAARARRVLNQKYNLEDSLHELLLTDPMTQLLAILANPRQPWSRLSQVAGIHAEFTHRQNPDAFGPLISFSLDGERFALTFRVVDGEPNIERWRWFLRLANLLFLNGYDVGGNIVSVEDDTALAASAPAPAPAAPPAPEPAAAFAEPWQRILDDFRGEEPAVVAALELLAGTQSLLPEGIGSEINGVPTVVSWPEQKIVVVYPDEADSFTDAADDGWTIIDSETLTVDAIPSALLNPH
ncbi:DEAD/DEAH box helicase [Corynebacterium uterequi]|uniref:Helicase family protein with metal-binding cysteine cluster n=1 Tax=Corynebacterium uterequi TaxID=1072256 RepID=A0A0G3HF87_9CORY|nr:DEAD/DEAH box helicase [Corynebacterium uterequi]AKK12016.1 helicase family protein with metal-binding cysteine cluster [Corynebacterium uterequi]